MVTPSPLLKRSVTLYRHFNDRSVLLYVGVSETAMTRFAQEHALPWWDEVAFVRVKHFKTRAAALVAEQKAIREEHPLYNRMHRPTLLLREHLGRYVHRKQILLRSRKL